LMFVDQYIIVQFIEKIHQEATKYQNFIIPYLYEDQHVSGDTPPIISSFNPLNAELNPIHHLLALLGAHHILHVSRIRIKPY
jgi:hypothetical protein